MAFTLSSDAFRNDHVIPVQYTGEGEDISPPMRWSGAPARCKGFALICDDPDAPRGRPFVHWAVYHIPPEIHSLPENLPPLERLGRPPGAFQGRNSFLKIGYGGPMPPVGHGVHHYVFKLYALSEELMLTPGATKEELVRAMEGRILDAAQLIGKYERKGGREAA